MSCGKTRLILPERALLEIFGSSMIAIYFH